jgi:hypothetical protein
MPAFATLIITFSAATVATNERQHPDVGALSRE